MKYAMNVYVEAEQFLPEEDKIPDGVMSDGLRSPKEDPRSFWMLKSSVGTSYIKSGDYVITTDDGTRYIMERELFEQNYKLAED